MNFFNFWLGRNRCKQSRVNPTLFLFRGAEMLIVLVGLMSIFLSVYIFVVFAFLYGIETGRSIRKEKKVLGVILQIVCIISLIIWLYLGYSCIESIMG